MLKLLYNRIQTDISKNNLPQVDLDLQKLLMNTKYPHADYQFLIHLKCSVKKLIENRNKLTEQGIQKMIDKIHKAMKLSQNVQAQSK